MGSSFTSVQVHCGPDRIDEITAWLEEHLGGEGLLRVEPGEEADRSVLVVPGEPFTTVYDSRSDEVGEPAKALAKGLSRGLGVAAFSVLVHDSDVLLLSLYQRGKRRSRYDSNPGYFSGKLRKPRRPDKKARAWEGLLAPGKTIEDLVPVFSGEDLFAEAALPLLAEALGTEPGRLVLGYRYVRELELPEEAVHLAWRAAERPAWEQPVTGPPRLLTPMEQAAELHGDVWEEPPSRVQAAPGAEVVLSADVVSAGGPGQGLVVEVRGAPGPVELRMVRVVTLVEGRPHTVEASLEPRDGVLVAALPQVELLPGVSAMPEEPWQVLEALKAQQATQLHIALEGEARSVGSVELELRVHPLEHPEAGTRVHLGLDVLSTETRPLRASADVHPDQLGALLDDELVVALVVLEPHGAVERVQALARAMAPWTPQEGEVTATRYRGAGPGGLSTLASMVLRPKTSTHRARGFMQGKRARKLLGAWGDSVSLVDLTWDDDSDETEELGFLAFGTGIITSPGAVPALALGLGGPPERLDALEAALVAAIDAAAESVIQALVTRWGAPPTVDTTPYELAVGVHGQCTLERQWVERWLRAVGTGNLWLGPALRQRLGPEALAGLSLREVGGCLVVEVRDVAATERALAALLPSAQDWMEGMQHRYQD